jgi:dual-specificity kinase/CDC-like kinase
VSEEEEDHPQHAKPQQHSSSGAAVPSSNAHPDKLPSNEDPDVSEPNALRRQRTKHKKTKRPRSRSIHRRRRRHKRHCKRDSKDRHKSRRRRHEEEDSSSSSSPTSKKERKKSATSSESCKDDTVGHFEGGPGTMVGTRYEIVRDVGLGTFGRVVECLDLNRTNTTHRQGTHPHARRGRHAHQNDGLSRHETNHNNNSNATVAIKIVRNIKRYHESALIEADILQDVNKRGGRGRSLCGILLDRFDLPQGHYCLVFECLGPSLYDFLKQHDYRPFPLYCVRDFARQLLDALDFLHSVSLIHTDLKLENILLTTHQEIMYRGGRRNRQNRNRHDHAPQQQVVPASTQIKVIDFGGATYDHEKKSSVVNTRQYRAPEVILGLGWGIPSDLWSAGCIIAELYMGELLFATHDNAEHLALMERTIGPFPRHMLDRCHNSSNNNNNNDSLAQQVFDSHGWHKMERVLTSSAMSHVRNVGPLETLVTDHGLVQLLRSLLIIDPNVRATADQGIRSRFCTPSKTTS